MHGEPTHGCRFVAATPKQWVFGGWLLVGVGLLLHGGWSLQQGREGLALVEMAAGVLGMLVALFGLSREGGREVVIRGSLLTVTHGRRVRVFDLDDPALDVLVREKAIGFAYRSEPWVVVRSTDVEWAVFQALVLDRVLRTASHSHTRHRGIVA